MKIEEFTYSSSVDKTSPLYASIAFLDDGKQKPIIAVMHGFHGQSSDVKQDIQDLAERGLVAIAPDMRGRGKSGGRFDAGGLDVHDIVDALLEAVKRHPAQIDKKNINIVGYSGGGGNCFSAATRFPDLFHVSAPFFGISDYGAWYLTEDARKPEGKQTLKEAVGGSPSDKPDAYAARNACLAAGNSPQTQWHIFWDEEEKRCPPNLNEKFLEAYKATGFDHAQSHISRKEDTHRWVHGNRSKHPSLSAGDEIFCKDIFASSPDMKLPPKGTLTVCGYLVTRNFQVFVGDGQSGVVKVSYDLTTPTPKIFVVENPKDFPANISLKPPLSILDK